MKKEKERCEDCRCLIEEGRYCDECYNLRRYGKGELHFSQLSKANKEEVLGHCEWECI